jgi:hypothetical protein
MANIAKPTLATSLKRTKTKVDFGQEKKTAELNQVARVRGKAQHHVNSNSKSSVT